MTLLIKYATRGRRGLFFETLKNIEDTISTKDYLIVVCADNDDPEMKNIGTLPKNVMINYSDPHSKVEAINRLLSYLKFDWLVNMSDDMRFTVKDWDILMLKDIRSKWLGNDFFAHFNDGYVAEKLPTMSVIGWDYFKRDNYIYHPSYKSVSCDAEAMFVSQMRGRYAYFDQVYFNHIHPANCRFISDLTYRGNDKWGDADTQNYFERMAKGFEVDNPVMIPEEVKLRMAI